MTDSSTSNASREAQEIVDFWQAAGQTKWFAKDDAFDAQMRMRFGALHEQAASEQLQAWTHHPTSALALMILLDQFPRNAFRGTARMYATDALARKYAELAIARGMDQAVDAQLRMFFYLPYMHSENLGDQERCVQLYQGSPFLSYTEMHRDVIARFGRFPHRNPIVGRETTQEEQAYLDAGGFAG